MLPASWFVPPVFWYYLDEKINSNGLTFLLFILVNPAPPKGGKSFPHPGGKGGKRGNKNKIYI